MTKMNRRMKIASKMGKRIYKKMHIMEMMLKRARRRQFLGMSTEMKKEGWVLFSLGRSLNGEGEFAITGLEVKEFAPIIFRSAVQMLDDKRMHGYLDLRVKDSVGYEWSLRITMQSIRNDRFNKLFEAPRSLLGPEKFWDITHWNVIVEHKNDPYKIDSYWDLERSPEYKGFDAAGIEGLVGRTLVNIEGMEEGSGFVCMTDAQGNKFHMYHSQSCCESVSIADVTGDVSDLIGVPILKAEECSQDESEYPKELLEMSEGTESHTWTFYKLATRKGYVDLRWLGVSNGYYGEGVDFVSIPASIAHRVKGELN